MQKMLPPIRLRSRPGGAKMCIKVTNHTHHANEYRDRRQVDEGYPARDRIEDEARGGRTRTAHVAAAASAGRDQAFSGQAELARRSGGEQDRRMIVVDSSVWIDYFRGLSTPQTDMLDPLLGEEPLAIGDLILVEVLQGFSRDQDFNQARRLLATLEPI